MKKLIALLTFLWVFSATAPAQQTIDAVGLIGTIVDPTGHPLNGHLTLALNLANVRNRCTPPPYQVVPRAPITFKVTNGQIVNGSTASIITQDCMTPRSAYYVTLYDQNNKLIFADNWYLHQEQINNMVRAQDVGSMVSQGFGGPIVVAVGQGVVTNPQGDQSIIQPAGTNLIINSAICTGTCIGFGGGGSGGGSVSSVGLVLPSIFNVTQSPITGAGNLVATLSTEPAGTIFAGPGTGPDAAPSFRFLQSGDIPNNAANTTGNAGNVTGIVAIANGGTGTASPGLVAGTGIGLTGSWPNQTITNSLVGNGLPTQVALYGGGGVLGGDANITDTGSVISLTGTINVSSLSPSLCVATDASKNLTTTTCGGANQPSAVLPYLGSFASATTLNLGALAGNAVVTGTATVQTIVPQTGCSLGSSGPTCVYWLLSANGFSIQTSFTGGPTNNINGGQTGMAGSIVLIPPGAIVLFAYDPVNGLWHMSGDSVDASTGLFGIVPAANITDASLTGTSVLDNDYYQYNYIGGTTYSLGQMVVYNGQTYTSLIDNNVGHIPANTQGVDWASIGLACGQAVCPTAPSASSLASPQASTDTTATINAIGNFSPTGGCFYVDAEWECYQYTSGNTFIGLSRGVYGTTAVAHSNGAGVQGAFVLGGLSTLPGVVVAAGYAAPPMLAINNPFPDYHAGRSVLDLNVGGNETWWDNSGAVHQMNNGATNTFYGPIVISSGPHLPALNSSGFVMQAYVPNEMFAAQGFGGGINGSVAINSVATVGVPFIDDFSGGGTATRSYVCSATDFDGNTVPGTTSTRTTYANSFVPGSSFVSIVCPWTAGIQSFQIWRTAGGPSQGLLATIAGIEGAQFFDFNAPASGGTPPAINTSSPKLSIAGTLHQTCDTSTNPQTCTILGAGVPTGCGTTYGLGSSYGNETGTLSSLFYICSPPGTQYNAGQPASTGTNIPGANFINSIYTQTGTNTGGYTIQSISVYVGSGGTAGSKIDVGLITAPSSTTQGTSWLCHATYTETSTPPNAYVTVPITGCGTLTPSTFYWVAYDTNDGGVNLGNYNCGSSCSGAAGSATYGSRFVSATYGVYTGLTTALSGPNPTQISAYATITGLQNEWVNNFSGNNIITNGGSGGGGSGVTSVGLSLPSVFSVTGSPVTATGTLTATFAGGQTANQSLMTPNGTTGALTLRSIVAADLPTFNTSGAGIVPASGGGSVNYLRADGTWAAPSGSGGSPLFTNIQSGTNTGQALVVGNSSSLTASGGGIIAATSVNGNTYPGSASVTQYGLLYGATTSSVLTTAASSNTNFALFATATVPAFRAITLNDWGSGSYVAASGATNAYTASLSPAPTSLFTGMEVKILPNSANTSTTPTLNINGFGTATITKYGRTALIANDLNAVAVADLIYDGLDWQLQNPQTGASAGTSIYIHTMTGTTPTATVASTTVPATDYFYQTLTANSTSITLPASSSVADGQIFKFVLSQATTGGPFTLPTGSASSPLTTGSGTTLINIVPGGCPTLGTTVSTTAPSQLFIDVRYQVTFTEYQIVGCTTGSPTQSGVVEWSLGNTAAGSVALNQVIASTTARNSGKFYNLEVVNQTGGSCTTAPTFNVFDGTTNVGTPQTGSTTIQSKGIGADVSQTGVAITAGDRIGIYVSTAGSACTSTFIVTAQIQEP